MTGAFVYLAGLAALVVVVPWGIMRGLDLLGRCDADDVW